LIVELSRKRLRGGIMDQTLPKTLIVALILSGAAFAQSSTESLADVARANREQQQTQQAAGTAPKVITNQDLPAGSTPVPQSSTLDSMTTVSGVNHPNRYSDQQLSNRLTAEQRAGAQWKARIEDQESRIADLQARIDRANQSLHAAVGTAQYDAPVNRYQALQVERLFAMQQTLDQQKRRLAMMQDAARRAGMDQ
jgi:hypothetical protein